MEKTGCGNGPELFPTRDGFREINKKGPHFRCRNYWPKCTWLALFEAGCMTSTWGDGILVSVIEIYRTCGEYVDS